MTMYIWEGKNAKGEVVKGEMEAITAQQVFNALRSQRITPNTRKIKEKGKGLDKEIKIPGMGPKVKQKEVVVFTRQFATMIDAGLPLVQGLDVLGKTHINPAMRKMLTDVREQVQTGGTLAEALARHPKAFDDLFVNMVRAGEIGGVLDVILERLADLEE